MANDVCWDRNIENLVTQIQSLHEQVNTLTSSMNVLIARDTMCSSKNVYRTGREPLDREKLSSAQRLSFYGPTTSSFSFGIARKSLQTRGITEFGETDITQEPSPMPSPSLSPQTFEHQQPIDPLWAISKEEALRLCHVYEEEMGIMYPVIELEQTVSHVNALYTHVRTGATSRPHSRNLSNSDIVDCDDINILKLVFACALTAEENGHSDLGMQIFNSVKSVANDTIWKPPNIKRSIFMTLMVRVPEKCWKECN